MKFHKDSEEGFRLTLNLKQKTVNQRGQGARFHRRKRREIERKRKNSMESVSDFDTGFATDSTVQSNLSSPARPEVVAKPVGSIPKSGNVVHWMTFLDDNLRRNSLKIQQLEEKISVLNKKKERQKMSTDTYTSFI